MRTLLLLTLLLYRLLISTTTRTTFSPDEYYQSIEPAHHFTYTKGHLTHEWQNAIRSTIYPTLIAIPYTILKITNTDTANAVLYAPKILGGIIAAAGDVGVYKYATKMYGKNTGNVALLLSLISWLLFYTSTRLLTNSLDFTTTAWALYYFLPKNTFDKQQQTPHSLTKAFLIAAFSCCVRPTNAILWLPVGIDCLIRAPTWNRRIHTLVTAVLVGASCLGITALLDYKFYGRLTFPAWNFIMFNVSSAATFYGEHGLLWYLWAGIPICLTTLLPWFITGLWQTELSERFLYLYPTLIASISLVPHKEFRFLMPLMPSFLATTANGLTHYRKSRGRGHWVWLLVFLGCTQLIPAGYLNWYHHRGADAVMSVIRDDPSIKSVFFAMPCHSTPGYAYIHRDDLRLGFVECRPPPDVNEEALFYEDPVAWMVKHGVGEYEWVVSYDQLEREVGELGYTAIRRFTDTCTRMEEGDARRGDIVLWRKAEKRRVE